MTDLPIRKIIHIDMDAFFASVEQRDYPELRGKPIAVGGSSERGVVAAASYEARKYGVRSAMSSVKAAQLCSDLIFVKHHFDVYKEVSSQIREIFSRYTNLIEPLSLDEAYLDVTHNKKNIQSATEIAQEIRAQIKAETQLTASAGVSFNKFLAKVASDINKPNGIAVIRPKHALKFMEKLPIERFFGIGKVTAKKMHGLGISHGLDLKGFSRNELIRRFGKSGSYYFDIVRGIDDRSVNPNRIRKSMSTEHTFEEDLISIEDMEREIISLSTKIMSWAKQHDQYGKTLNLKATYTDFKKISRSKTLEQPIIELEQVKEIALTLLKSIDFSEKGVRLLGLGFSSFQYDDKPVIQQLTLDF